jgi:O-6-methylguanine DNA methyltransferase
LEPRRRWSIFDDVRLAYHVMSSPLGLLFLARTARGLALLQFMDRRSLKRTIAAQAAAYPDATWEPSLLELKPVVDQLESWFCGTTSEFHVALDPVGTEFQLQVWGALRRIPYAETRSYGEIAKAIGQPKAARAVGLANNQNPIAIIVPCHRVIGADGALVGYGGGMPRKRKLLDLEARFGRPVGKTGDLFAAATDPRPAREPAGRRAPRPK